MSEIASELARRASPSHMKDKMKEATVRKSVEIKERTLRNPLALGLIGGLVSAGVARLIRGRRVHVDIEEGGAEGVEVEHPAEEKLAGAKEKLAETKERISHAVETVTDKVKESMPSGEELKRKARSMKESVGEALGEQPVVAALGAVALGAALGFLFPSSRWERSTFRPVRERASDKLEELADTVRGKADELEEKVAGEPRREVRTDFGPSGVPPPPPRGRPRA